MKWTTEKPPWKERATERLWAKVHKSTECWEWRGLTDRDGYGRIRPGFGRVYWRAHRLSWLIHRGPIPEGMHVLHRCDNPPCVRPEHLFLGTNRENIDDRVRKGRSLSGERHPLRTGANPGVRGSQVGTAKLSEASVKEILSLIARGRSMRSLAREFAVSHFAIQQIHHGRRWKHVHRPIPMPEEEP